MVRLADDNATKFEGFDLGEPANNTRFLSGSLRRQTSVLPKEDGDIDLGSRLTFPPPAEQTSLPRPAATKKDEPKTEQLITSGTAGDAAIALEPTKRVTQLQRPSESQDEKQARLVMRRHFILRIEKGLSELSRSVGNHQSAIYADDVLRTLLATRDIMPEDPLTHVMLALHDAMAINYRWAEYKAPTYGQAASLIGKLADRQLTRDLVEKTIDHLEAIGFDTLP